MAISKHGSEDSAVGAFYFVNIFLFILWNSEILVFNISQKVEIYQVGCKVFLVVALLADKKVMYT